MDPNPYESPQQPEGLLPATRVPQRKRKPFHWVIIGTWLVMIGIAIFHATISWLEYRDIGYRSSRIMSPALNWGFKISFPILMSGISVYHIVRAWRGLPEHFWKKPN